MFYFAASLKLFLGLALDKIQICVYSVERKAQGIGEVLIMAQAHVSRKKLGDILVQKGIITQDQLTKALETQKKNPNRLGKILIDAGLMTEELLSECLAQQLAIPHISIRFYQTDEKVLDLVPKAIAERLRVIPLDHIGKILTVAISDTISNEEMEELEKATGCRLKFFFISPSDFDYGFEVLYVRREQEAASHKEKEAA